MWERLLQAQRRDGAAWLQNGVERVDLDRVREVPEVGALEELLRARQALAARRRGRKRANVEGRAAPEGGPAGGNDRR